MTDRSEELYYPYYAVEGHMVRIGIAPAPQHGRAGMQAGWKVFALGEFKNEPDAVRALKEAMRMLGIIDDDCINCRGEPPVIRPYHEPGD